MAYQTILTNYGLQRMAQAEAAGATINLVAMAVGDGNGNPTTPDPAQTQLVRETYRHAINRVYQDPDNPLMFIAELVIPATEGGFTIREAGIFDDANKLFAVANTPAAYKPQGDGSEGAFGDTVLRMQFLVTNATVVNLQVDPNVAVASQSWVIGTITLPFLLKGGTTGQVLSKKSNADGDVIWVDAAAAVDVIVDAIAERQTLAAGQTVVNLATITTDATAVYIEGIRLIETIDFTINSPTRFTLARSYPDGSRIHMYQNDPTSEISDATETQHGFIKLATTAEVTAGTDDAHAVTSLKLAQRIVGIIGDARNLYCRVAANSAQATFTAEQIVVGTSGANPVMHALSQVSLAVNLATTGAGGMDTGASPASDNVAVYAIFNPTTGDVKPLCQAMGSAVAPSTYQGTHPVAGYTESALISSVKTDSTGKFAKFLQVGRRISTAAINVTIPNASSTWTALSAAAAVTPNAKKFSGDGAIVTTVASNISLFIATNVDAIGAKEILSSASGGSISEGFSFDDQQIDYVNLPQQFAFNLGATPGSLSAALFRISSYEI